MMTDNLHKFWWLFIPLIAIALQAVLELSFPADVLASMHSESGPHELLQFFIMTLAFIWSLRILLLKPWTISAFLAGWVSLAALACLYVSGEEMSWGQHILQWNTPEYWHEINDQGETNFHNTSSWLDQKPRLILEIGILVGGLIIPLLLRFKPDILPQQFSIIYPTAQFIPMTVVAIGINVADKIGDALDITIFERASEVEELYLFYFVLFYLILLRRRVAQQKT